MIQELKPVGNDTIPPIPSSHQIQKQTKISKVIEILGIRKTWLLLGTISSESLPYIEHTRLCLVWLLE